MCKNFKQKWKYFFRQMLICSGVWSLLFILGLNIGTPTVLVPQLREEANTTEAVTIDEASWLPAIMSYSGIPWVLILSTVAALKGRKLSQLIACICTFIGYIIFYCSSNVHHVMFSMIFQGAAMAFYLTTAIIVITEYTCAEYRGFFLTLKSATFFWGVLTANTIGTFLHWRIIPCVGLGCSAYSLITVYFWPESPLWLAKQGRFDESVKSNRWLQGLRENSEKELYKCEITKNKNYWKYEVMHIRKIFFKKEFYKPIFLTILLFSLYLLSGKLVCTVYAVDILKTITNDRSTAYTGMLILDGVTLLSMYAGCGFARVFKRRTLLLIPGTMSVTFLLLISLYLYLVKFLAISENSYVSIVLLTGFSITVGCGPMTLSLTISGELLPMASRNFVMCLNGVAFKIMSSSLIKVSPYIFICFGVHGTFLFFCLSCSTCLVLVYFYLPETKDKTLQEIADCIKGVTTVEESKELLPITRNNVTFKPKNVTDTEKL